MMDVILYRWYSNAKLFGRKFIYDEDGADRKSTRLNSSHNRESRMPSSA